MSLSVLDASHIIRQRDVAADVALNRTFQGGVRAVSNDKLHLTPGTENRNITDRRLRDDSDNIVRRDVRRAKLRRHRRHKRQNGLSCLYVVSIILS